MESRRAELRSHYELQLSRSATYSPLIEDTRCRNTSVVFPVAPRHCDTYFGRGARSEHRRGPAIFRAQGFTVSFATPHPVIVQYAEVKRMFPRTRG